MKNFLNEHPIIALAMVCVMSGAAVKIADIIKTKSIVDAVDVIVVKKESKEEKEEVESVEE